jgi:5'-3' exonuclease
MILVDYSGSIFAAISVELNRNMGLKTDIDFLRHIILKQLKSYHRKFHEDYGEMVVCLDCRTGNWRKELFPAYKFARKKKRIDSGVDWDKIFKDVNTITEEFRKELPYKFVMVDNLEADDVIALLAKNAPEIAQKDVFGDMLHPVLIISNDKDYKQLHKYPYVKQYYPKKQAIGREQDPEFALQDLIIHGDKSDGIPNIRSDKNIFMEDGRRQTSISTDFMRRFLKEGVECLSIFEKERYEFNKMLISFDEIPSKYEQEVIEEYKKEKTFNRFNLMQYFARHRLKEMIDHIGDF